MAGSVPVLSVADLVAEIRDGDMLAVPKDDSGVAMAATRALIRRGARDLHLLCVPVSSLQADLLIGAGCVAVVEAGGLSIRESGVAPRFREAVRRGSIRLKDSTCPAIHAALQAGEKGQPFVPLRGILGTDILAHRDDWKVIDNPFAAGGDPVVLLPAINPDITLFHAAWADREGNVWIGGRRDLAYMAHAARRTLVTVEAFWDGRLLDDETMAAGTLSGVYVAAMAHAPRGAWPIGLPGRYPPDHAHLKEYADRARTDEGFARYLEAEVYGRGAAA